MGTGGVDGARERLLAAFPGLAWTVDRDLRFTAGAGGLALDPGEWNRYVGRTLAEVLGADERSSAQIDAHRRALDGETVEYDRIVDGHELRVRVQPLQVDGDIVGAVGLATDIDAAPTARAAAHRRVAQQEAVARLSLAALGDSDEEALLQLAVDFAATGLDAGGASVAELLDDGRLLPRARHNMPMSGPVEASGLLAELALGGSSVISVDLANDPRFDPLPGEYGSGSLIAVPIPTVTGLWGTLAVRTDDPRAFSELDLAFVEGLVNALSAAFERRQLDAARRDLEHRLHQSQRLESLGQLAGGVAHDFNNLLAVILNYASFAAKETIGNDAAQADIAQIQAAAERAAGLTRQLLVFARRETVQPEILDVNSVVAGVHRLLTSTIGEHVMLVVRAAPTLPGVRADRGQLEQLLVNLAVNARDAMADGGTLTIETGCAELDAEVARLHTEVRPGSYVELTVTDTGVGMAPDVAARAFEPFFTTKGPGAGTGLGLATVYGIVAETGGSVTLRSEVGAGTTVQVHLPAADAPAPAPVAQEPPRDLSGHGGTILVVEDEPALLEVASRILRRNGYSVLAAASGEDALALAADQDFDLLLTDSVMPQMSGRVLADHLAGLRPGLPVLFMSGYSEGILGPGRVLNDGVALLQKPFDEPTLLGRVRDILAPPATAG